MRSRDLARLAGVSVRTLRHYHQIGVLPEPERSANGYRAYTAADLVRVLRVRRLAELGVPLANIDSAVDVDDELAQLDRRYAQQIEELQERREIISGLRRRGPHADVPAYALEYIAALGSRADVTPESMQTEGDAAAVLELLLDSPSLASLGALSEAESAQLAAVAADLLALDDAAPMARIDDAAAALAGVMHRLQSILDTRRLSGAVSDSIDLHFRGQLNDAQIEAARRAAARYDDLTAGFSGEDGRDTHHDAARRPAP
ncbi:MerR family transcriptional regulator [Homoserinibacter sp. YIM 151385]|uniref:MerR family transcriptional regulator n=1 Tax=Homoserinibacter sp. YIM 151385 TaxID=2985506 RepID=UPI0022F133B5|nr:MerR family transcriptional regulator [Homoserinibacter sp. YIM 151385]WBU37154.1 MerR family transcriptional regulator [Homoserinibacter sp. YIM 151385]